MPLGVWRSGVKSRWLAASWGATATLSILLASCGGPPEPEPEEEARFRGHLVWGHEVRSFTPCDGGGESWVQDEAGGELARVAGELAREPYDRLFVEVRGREEPAPAVGFGADYPRVLAVVELLRAEVEGFGCRRDPPGLEMRAFGNEPFWNVEIGDRIVLRRLDHGESAFARTEPRLESSVRVYESERDPPEAASLRIELRRERCVDSMSGSRYAWAARVSIDGDQLEGCAFEGAGSHVPADGSRD